MSYDSFFWDKIICFSSTQNKLLDVNKTYIDIGNRQKFELLVCFEVYFQSCSFSKSKRVELYTYMIRYVPLRTHNKQFRKILLEIDFQVYHSSCSFSQQKKRGFRWYSPCKPTLVGNHHLATNVHTSILRKPTIKVPLDNTQYFRSSSSSWEEVKN